MSPALAADREARRLAQEELRRPLLIEAGAGTGKTATLVARVLAWCLGPGWARAEAHVRQTHPQGFAPERPAHERIAARTLRRVVAITFTEAAAAEMAARVSAGLAEVAAGAAPVGFILPADLSAGELAERARALVAVGDQLQVRTIHSFCRQLLAAHPFEAGVHPRLTIDADGTRAEEIVQDVVEAALVHAYGDAADPDFLLLAKRGHGPSEIAAALLWLTAEGLGETALAMDPLAPELRHELVHRLATACAGVSERLRGRLGEAKRAKNAQLIEAALGELGAELAAAPGLEIAALQEQLAERLPGNLLDHLRKWARGSFSETETEHLGAAAAGLAVHAGVLERLVHHVACLDPELLGAAHRALRPLLAQVEREMRRRGVASFSDLLRGARRLLAEHPAVLVQVRRGIDQLLVDEFQDTDRLQCDLVRALALEGPEDERPGLFVVGDPKQSIYGWRSADLRAYEDFAAQLEAAGGARLPLSENFRSVPAILAEVERVLTPVMQRRPGLQPAFEPLLACEKLATAEGFRRGRWAPVEHWVSWCRGKEGAPAERTGAEDATRLEARAVASDLLALHRETGLRWSEAALLLRSTGDLEVYLAALRAAGIPFAVSRNRQFYRRREVIDAGALVRAVLAPEDHLALVTLLRSAMVGVPDAALLPLWSRDFPRRMTELRGPDPAALAGLRELIGEVAAGLPADIPGLERIAGWEHDLRWAVETLAELRQAFEREPADRFLDQLRRSTFFEVSEAARYLGAYRIANLERFFTELLAALEEHGGNRHRVLRVLRRRVERGFEAEDAPPETAGQEVVTVMTLHQAKGLEFRHVYLLQLHKQSRGQGEPAFGTGEVDGRRELRLFGTPSLGFDRVAEERSAVERAERVRLLYVAMTRAAERLVLAGNRPAGEPVEPERAASHADLLGHRMGEGASEKELHEQWERSEERLEHDGASWVFPALSTLEIEGLELQPIEPPPAVAELRAAQEQLATLRQAAAQRMARPFQQAPSKLAAEEKARVEGETPAERRAERAASELETSAARQIAMLAGTAVHRVLEHFDLETLDPAVELAAWRGRLGELIAVLEPESQAELEAARQRAAELLERFGRGPLFERFMALRGRVMARELPVLLPPIEGAGGPVGFLAGSVDLLCRDDDGRLVVVDFKTDEVTVEQIEEHARRYQLQGAAYVRALGEALALERAPRFELWYLACGRVAG